MYDELPSLPPPPRLRHKQKRPQSPRPSPSLPTLRLMIYPRPGLGVDARLPLTKHFRCFLSLESYFQGSSNTRFGIESNRLPFLRLDLAPSTRFSIRPSPIRFSDLKFGVLGSSLTAYDGGKSPKYDRSSLRSLWQSLRPFLNPIVELNHRNTLFGSFVDSRQRRALNNVIDKIMDKQNALPFQVRQSRDALLESLRQREMPPLDHRVRKDTHNPIEDRLKGQFEYLKDPSSRSKSTHLHWPGVSRDDSQSLGGDSSVATNPNSTLPGRPRDDGPSVVGHVKPGKDGRLQLLRSDGSIADDEHNDAIENAAHDDKGLARLFRQVRTRFRNN